MNSGLPFGSRVLLHAASLVIVVAGLKVASPVLVPIVFAALLAVLTSPLVLRLRRWKIPTWVSIPLIVLGVLAALGGIGGFVGGSVNAFAESMPRYQERLTQAIGRLSDWLQGYGWQLSQEKLTAMVQPNQAMSLLGTALSQVAAMLSNVLLVILTMIFILLEVTGLPLKIRRAMGDPTADLSRFVKITDDIKNYLVIKTYVSIATGLIVGGMVWALGIDFPALWGLLAFLLNYVPNIGSVFAAIPPALLALLMYGPGRALIVLGGFAAINMVIGNVVEPQLMGRRLGLSALVVFLSLVLWGWLWGAAGMLLSVPLTMMVKIFLEHSEQGRWLAVLMDPAPGEGQGNPDNESDEQAHT